MQKAGFHIISPRLHSRPSSKYSPMTSRNLAIVFVLVAAVAVAYLLGKNVALQEQLTESEANQQLLRQSLVSSPAPRATADMLTQSTATSTPKPSTTPPASSKDLPERVQGDSGHAARVAAQKADAPTPNPKPPCEIIGNKNSGIYHLPGCASYSRIASYNREYFCTEEEARKAGYRKARNC